MALVLAHMGPAAREAIPALGKLLQDRDPRVARAPAPALGFDGCGRTCPCSHARQAVAGYRGSGSYPGGDGAGQMGPAAKDAVPYLRAAEVADPDADVRTAVGSALEAIDPSLKVLVDALKSSDTSRRLWAVSALTAMGVEAKEAVPNLSEVLKQDEAAPVRGGRFCAGQDRGRGSRSLPRPCGGVQDGSARVRTGAALALGLLGAEAHGAERPLAETLRDEDAEVAAAAATALGNLGPRAATAVPVLQEMLKHGDLALRRRAVNVLARIGPAAARRCRLCSGSSRTAMLSFAATLPGPWSRSGPSLPLLYRRLLESLRCNEKEGDCNVRAWACLSLAEAGPAAEEAVPALVAALQDTEPNVRAAAGLALGRVGPAAVAQLVKALDNVDARVRGGAPTRWRHRDRGQESVGCPA